MSDLWAVVLALAVAAGALSARPVPLVVAGAVVALGFAGWRPTLLCLGAALLASGLAARAWDGLEPPAARPVSGEATLVSDPERRTGEVRALARLHGRRVRLHARGGAAGVLANRLAGERVTVSGQLRPLAAGAARALARRHVAARVDVTSTGGWSEGGPVTRLANTCRRTLARGAESLPADHRSLLAGFLLGDDRDQTVEVRDDFRGSGLAHLLAVSGQNVAYVLALVAPLISRLGLRGRLGAGLAVLAVFGVLTRWEPSVLRATTMAALTMVAAALGRPVSTLRTVALAAAALLLVDPLLVGSLGFLLSVGACTGIALFSAPIARRLPGPRPVAEALAVTIAAQTGVAPVILPVFGELPVASLAANLLAAPAVGPITVWGIAAGLPAGLIGGTAATVLHLPTRVLVGWVAGVARWGASVPLGQLGARHAAVLVVAALVALAARPPARRLAVAVMVLTVATPAAVSASLARSSVAGHPLVDGAQLWRAGGAAVVVVDQPDPGRLLRALRSQGVRRLDVVVARRRGAEVARSLEPVLSRVPARVVAAQEREIVPGAVAVKAGDRIRVGTLVVEVAANGRALTVDVRPA